MVMTMTVGTFNFNFVFFFLIHIGSDVVLGPPHPISMERTDLGVPIEQAISRQRLRPGSGTLCVRVTTDGPTRVLQVMDINKSNVIIIFLTVTRRTIMHDFRDSTDIFVNSSFLAFCTQNATQNAP